MWWRTFLCLWHDEDHSSSGYVRLWLEFKFEIYIPFEFRILSLLWNCTALWTSPCSNTRLEHFIIQYDIPIWYMPKDIGIPSFTTSLQKNKMIILAILAMSLRMVFKNNIPLGPTISLHCGFLQFC